MRSITRLAFPLAVTVCLGAVSPAARAFESEKLAAPVAGARVGPRLLFYIEASGRPAQGEAYRIEIASDPKFNRVVATFDMQKEKSGWMLGDPQGISLKDVPEQYRPVQFEGIHLRCAPKLADGEYWWRAQKTVGGGWQPIAGVETFTLDTRPPEAVDSLRLRMLSDGRLQMYWDPVMRDSAGYMESVSGFRVYRFTRLLKRYPMQTRYLAGEVKDTQFMVDKPRDDNTKIVFYLVHAVDEVGNEEGRRGPAPLGTYNVKFDPPSLDEILQKQRNHELNEEPPANGGQP